MTVSRDHQHVDRMAKNMATARRGDARDDAPAARVAGGARRRRCDKKSSMAASCHDVDCADGWAQVSSRGLQTSEWDTEAKTPGQKAGYELRVHRMVGVGCLFKHHRRSIPSILRTLEFAVGVSFSSSCCVVYFFFKSFTWLAKASGRVSL